MSFRKPVPILVAAVSILAAGPLVSAQVDEGWLLPPPPCHLLLGGEGCDLVEGDYWYIDHEDVASGDVSSPGEVVWQIGLNDEQSDDEGADDGDPGPALGLVPLAFDYGTYTQDWEIWLEGDGKCLAYDGDEVNPDVWRRYGYMYLEYTAWAWDGHTSGGFGPAIDVQPSETLQIYGGGTSEAQCEANWSISYEADKAALELTGNLEFGQMAGEAPDPYMTVGAIATCPTGYVSGGFLQLTNHVVGAHGSSGGAALTGSVFTIDFVTYGFSGAPMPIHGTGETRPCVGPNGDP